MIGNLFRVTQEDLDTILADSSILEDRISDDSVENPELLKLIMLGKVCWHDKLNK